jgi:hypothetical protein
MARIDVLFMFSSLDKIVEPDVLIGVVQKQLPSLGRKTSAQSANLFSDKAIG